MIANNCVIRSISGDYVLFKEIEKRQNFIKFLVIDTTRENLSQSVQQKNAIFTRARQGEQQHETVKIIPITFGNLIFEVGGRRIFIS